MRLRGRSASCGRSHSRLKEPIRNRPNCRVDSNSYPVNYFLVLGRFFGLAAALGCGGVASIRRTVASKAGSNLAFGTIIPFPQWRVKELYAHVGKIATEWGFLDFAITGVVSILFSIPEAAKKEKVIPRGLAPRLRFIARTLRDLPELAAFQAEGQELVDRTRRFTPIRDGVIHGYPSMYEVETGGIEFFALEVDRDIHRADPIRLTIPDLIGTGDVCHRLAADFATFAHKLFDAGVARDRSDEPRGKGRR